MKNVRDAGFSRKRGGNVGSGPPFPHPEYQGKETFASNPFPRALFPGFGGGAEKRPGDQVALLAGYVRTEIECEFL